MFGWFKKRKPVEFERHDGEGGVRKGTTSKERLEELEAKGVLKKLDACVSHYWDPRLSKPTTKNLIIGEDIKRETYEKFKDAKGDVHVVGVFKAGELELSYVSKPLWDDMMRATGNAYSNSNSSSARRRSFPPFPTTRAHLNVSAI